MRSIYNSLQTLAFRTSPENASFTHACHMLQVPPEWKRILREMAEQNSGRNSEWNSIPVVSLHKTLRALVPDLIAIEASAWRENTYANEVKPWLYAAQPIDTEALCLIVHAWANTVFSSIPVQHRLERLSNLRPEDLRWTTEVVDLAAQKMSSNGTAEPRSPHAYHLLPDLLAAKLSRQGVQLETEGEPLRFRRAPLPTTPSGMSSSGAELISWPPRREKVRGKAALFSLVLNFSVQTVPFQNFPVVHCGIGRRRWVYEPNSFFPSGKDTSVYLLTSVPWLEGLQHSPAFQVATMRWQRIPEAERTGKMNSRAVWSDDLALILEKLRPQHPFPKAEEIRLDPTANLNESGTSSAAIVFRTGMTPLHKAGVGAPPRDRRDLTVQLEKILSPEMMLVEPLERVAVKSRKIANPFPTEASLLDDTRALELQTARRRIIGASFKGEVSFEIWFQSQREREALQGALRSKLGMKETEDFLFSLDNVKIHLQAKSIDPLAGPLDVPGTWRDKSSHVRDAIELRAEEVAKRISPASHPTIALVQIGEQGSFIGRSDPKAALRYAFARVGRLTQFLATSQDAEEQLAHRASSAVLDGLRQLGLQMPFAPSQKQVYCVGLWVVKQDAGHSRTGFGGYLPVLVRVNGITGEVQAIAGLMNSWQPYHDVLRMVGCGEVRGVSRQKDVPALVHDLVQRDLIAGDDTLLLCHAQNTRTFWPWLTNGKLTPDYLAFGMEPPEPMADWPGLRIIRVRENQNHETPEYYALHDAGKTGFTQGLFRVGERVFMSLNPKPVQIQPNTNRSMLKSWKNSQGRVYSPSVGEYDHNPALCELTVVGLQPGDEPETWAALAHHLRSVATHYQETTSLPIALHLASQIKHYILPLSFEQSAT